MTPRTRIALAALACALLAGSACNNPPPAISPRALAPTPRDPSLLVSYVGRWDGAHLSLARLNPDGTEGAVQADTLGTVPSSSAGQDVTVVPPTDTVVLQQTTARGVDTGCNVGVYVEPASPPSAVPNPFQGVCFNIEAISGFASRELIRAFVQITSLANSHDSGAIVTYNNAPDNTDYGVAASPGLWYYGRLAPTGTTGVRVAGGPTVNLSRFARNWFFATPEPGASAAFTFRADVRALAVNPVQRAAPASPAGAECVPLGRPSLSQDGAYVAFETSSSACRGGVGGAFQVVRRAVATGATVLVSHATSGAGNGANGQSTEVSISADGSLVAWESTATDLLPGGVDAVGDSDSNGAIADIFVRDVGTDAIYLGDVDFSTTATGPLASHHPLLSSTGTNVTFESANVLDIFGGDGNALVNVYNGDVFNGFSILVSPDTGSRTLPATRGAPTYFADRVAFQSDDPSFSAGDTNGVTDVFVQDLNLATTTRVSATSGGGAANGPATLAAIAAGGQFVAFQSSATNMAPSNATGAISGTHVYVYAIDGGGGALPGALLLADVSAAGAVGNGDATLASLSQGGRYVGFVSASNNLDPLDASTGLDAYFFDAFSADPRRTHAVVLSTTVGNAPSNAVASAGIWVDPDEEYVALCTSTALAGGSPPSGPSVYVAPLR